MNSLTTKNSRYADFMHRPPARNEIVFAFSLFALLLLACFGPNLAQDAHYHDFADQRSLMGIAHAMDVLSNLPFFVLGALGLFLLAPQSQANAFSMSATFLSHGVFFAGLILTAVGSAWYHFSPNDAGLAVDRLTMAVSFAGIVALAVSERLSQRAGLISLVLLLLLAPAAVAVWAYTSNVLPWAVVQFGGLLALALLSFVSTNPTKLQGGAPAVAWWQVIVIYALAKAFEHFDAQVFELTAHWVSGHSLKHVVASLAALPLIRSLR
jgi:hypothetical protein